MQQWKNVKTNESSEEGITYHKKKSTIETKFDKDGNNISMLETSNEVDKEKVTKDKNISLSRDPIYSFPSGILESIDKHDI